jgi:nucleotide-binding universal stress UspA family protein
MTLIIGIAAAVAGLAVGLGAGFWLPPHGHRPARDRAGSIPVNRILLPFTGQQISRRAFEAAVRIAKAEDAMLMPAFLARVPRTLPLESPLPVQCAAGMPLLEAIEQKATREGVAVDSRVSRGRSYRDALRRLLETEQFDRIVVSATESASKGLSSEDLEWLLDRVPAEVLILRPAPEDTSRISGAEVHGHF